MIIGVPKEIKNSEYRVAVTPGGVDLLVKSGHSVLVETHAGIGSSFPDDEYARAGARICATAGEVFAQSELIVKVKEPLHEEYDLMRQGQLLFTFLHLAAARELTGVLIDRRVTAIGYETVQTADGRLPLLTPMSEVAGRMSVQAAAHFLEKENGGSGTLLGGVPGVKPGSVVIIGGGIVGTNAAQMALGLGAHVTVIDKNVDRLRYLSEVLRGNFVTIYSTPYYIAQQTSKADVVVGAVLVPGAKAPVVVTREMVRNMMEGSVIVDVAIDQGGCIETARPTTHSNPTYVVDGVVHYCVTNIPGAVPRTSTVALSNATLPYVLELANLGFERAVKSDPALAGGVNICNGKITNKAVADAFGLEFHALSEVVVAAQ